MSNLSDRQQAFENKYAHDEQLKFRVAARRAKLAGLWVAEMLGLSGAAADDYAKTVVMADLEYAGDQDLIDKIDGDLRAKGIDPATLHIERKLQELQTVAKQQVMEEVK